MDGNETDSTGDKNNVEFNVYLCAIRIRNVTRYLRKYLMYIVFYYVVIHVGIKTQEGARSCVKVENVVSRLTSMFLCLYTLRIRAGSSADCVTIGIADSSSHSSGMNVSNGDRMRVYTDNSCKRR